MSPATPATPDTGGTAATRQPAVPDRIRAVVLDGPDRPVRIEERPVPEPATGQVLLRVDACGMCGSEVNLLHGHYPFAVYPTVPGHEIAATVAATGGGVDWPRTGDRVGMPFLNSSCGHCHFCVRGDEILCQDKKITGINSPGGYQEYMVAPAAFVAPLPGGLDPLHAAPLMCAGVTTFNGLRRGGLRPGTRVAVIGTGGLGGMAARFAVAMGGRLAVLARSAAAEPAARAAGAEVFLTTEDPERTVTALRAWEGGPQLVVNTAPSTAAVNAVLPGVAPDGTVVLLGYDAATKVEAASLDLVMGRVRVMGSPSGSRHDLRDALAFAAAHGITPEVTAVRLDDAPDVIAAMAAGRAGGKSVIDFG
ncbi:hypothetical protein CTZ27_37740 [Streptomyces griseocarneus]|nr:hypothetical protein CTZ27_37740 [Streptomyces griseocarneus]